MNASRKKKKQKAYIARLVAQAKPAAPDPGTDIQKPAGAMWVPEDVRTARCSNCNFGIEASRAVETGWSALEYSAVRYKFCPMCGMPMDVPDGPGPE